MSKADYTTAAYTIEWKTDGAFERGLNVLEEAMTDARVQSEVAVSAFMSAVIDRNQHLAHLVTNDLSMQDGIGRKMVLYAGEDARIKGQIEYGVGGAIAVVEHIVGKLREELAELSRKSAADRETVQREIQRLKNVEVALNARHGDEHAINDPFVRDKVWAITDGKCFYCDVALVRSPTVEEERSRHFHVDHLVSKFNRGPNHTANYVPACARCNSAKRERPFAEFFLARRASAFVVINGGLVETPDAPIRDVAVGDDGA